ncbi:coiled-coil domain-containing protein [Halococcoides cellulosivorans]|uniref:Coiled coil protein n=1 Tax=Halococcoides cellulosivorans TaxID=1679096 RepID=A0A2R4X4A1_9EURY|nr:hypothetical protein [Halococcoides cellulosivorans]AWB28619.1 hypothetical protein HARCEL1_03875 [Halococcoides cellulosivorans]
MSDSESYDPVTVSSDGVTVAKRFEADEFPVPAIAFRIESHRSEPVTLELVDTVPEEVAVEDLGFHPEYGSEHWTIDNDEITFEREIDANDDYTTVYGIRATGTDNVEQFLTEPTIRSIDPPLEDDPDDIVDSGTGTDVVKEVISGDSDVVPGLDDDDDEIETLDLADPQGEDAESDTDDAEAETETTTESADTTSAETSSEETASEEETIQSVAAALAAELERGAVADPVKETLARELGGSSASPGEGSTDARIKHLQSEVSDLQAYTDALEEFLDDNGKGDELIEEMREEVDSFSADLDDLRAGQDEYESQIDDLESTIDQIQSTSDRLESDMTEIRDRVDDAHDEIQTLHEEIEDMDGVDDRVEEIESRIDDEVAALESDLDDIQEWREQLTSVMGAGE